MKLKEIYSSKLLENNKKILEIKTEKEFGTVDSSGTLFSA